MKTTLRFHFICIGMIEVKISNPGKDLRKKNTYSSYEGVSAGKGTIRFNM